jgi:hypothetical protein
MQYPVLPVSRGELPFFYRNIISLVSSKMNYFPSRLIRELIHAPGFLPRRCGDPVGIGLPGDPWIFRPFLMNPVHRAIIIRVGQGGGETPSCRRISGSIFYYLSQCQDVNRAEILVNQIMSAIGRVDSPGFKAS